MGVQPFTARGERLARLLQDPTYAPQGTKLGFGLQRQYSVCERERDWSAVAIMRWLEGDKIRSIGFGGFANPNRPTIGDDLERILQCCPNLTTLALIAYGVRSLQTLVDAYASESQPCRITSLAVVAGHGDKMMRDTACLPLLKMLSDPTHPGTHMLRHLSLSLVATRHAYLPAQFRAADVARMLATNVVLETVYVLAMDHDCCVQTPKAWKDATRALLECFQDQVLNDCRRVAIGLLSVSCFDCGRRDLLTGKRTRRFRQCSAITRLDETLVRVILSFVGATRVRCMRWVCGDEGTTIPN